MGMPLNNLDNELDEDEPQINLQDLAEEVFRLLKRELTLENERTGR